MKKTTLLSLLLLYLLGGNAWADELFYTLLTVPNATGSNHTSYKDYYDDEHDGMVWNAPGNQSLEGKWRIGGKELDKEDRTITAKTAMGSTISRVVVNHLGVSKAQITVHSMKLTIASNVDYSNVIDEVVLTPTVSNGKAGSVEFQPTSGTEWATEAYYKLTINLSNSSTSNGGIDLTSLEFYAPDGSGVIAKPVITPAGGTFAEPQEVTITADEGCDVFYTTDGTDPTNASTQYTAPFTVSEDCTVKAIAYDVAGAPSAVATASFQFASAVPTIGRLCALAPASGNIDVVIAFNNWVCTGVKGNNAYFTDGTNGILLFQSGHGFTAGDQLTGTATVSLTTYNGAPEVTGLTASTEGVTIAAKGVTVTPMEVSIADLENNMQGNVITVKEVTYDGTVLKDAAGASITPYNTFSITMPTLENGKTYDATGVFVWFKGTKEIAPRSTDDIKEAEVVVAKPVITPAGGTFAEPQTVTITADEGCTIIYTTDGSEPSVTAGITYTAPFTVSEDCIVKAVAYNEDDNFSSVTTVEFKFITDPAVPSIARLCAMATEEEQSVLVQFNDWYVTGVNGNQLYFTDGANGIVGYQKDHGFALGDKLTGTGIVNVVLFNECAEVTGLTTATEGLTVTKTEGATPMSVAIADLEKDMQGCLLHFDGITYTGGAFVDDDDNTIIPYNSFRLSDYPTLLEGKTYNVTGVAIWFSKDGVWEIAPRTADEFELVTSLVAPVSSWSVESEEVDINGTVTAVFTTNSDGAVTYTSSDEEVATVDNEGNITLVARGTTTITATVAETETYLADSKSFTLTVTEEGFEDATFVYNDEDIKGQGAPDTGAELTATRDGIVTLYANRAYAKDGDTHIKIYGSKYEGKDEERVLTEPSYVKLSVPENYIITDIVLTATGDSYIREWQDQEGNAATIEGATATWKGEQKVVILTNQATSQARLKSIHVSYMNTDEIGICNVSVSADGVEGAIYNLAGQRLAGMQKGINIVGGKKILK